MSHEWLYAIDGSFTGTSNFQTVFSISYYLRSNLLLLLNTVVQREKHKIDLQSKESSGFEETTLGASVCFCLMESDVTFLYFSTKHKKRNISNVRRILFKRT